jgi:CelD/BcsL family acetyltransferase involved in cellulose biosynthesis
MIWTFTPAAQLAASTAFADDWRRLHADSGASPMLDWDFVAPLLAEFGGEGEMLASCERNGRLAALAIVKPAGRGVWATYQPPQAPLGLWLQHPGEDLEALLHALLRALPGMPLVFGLTQMDPLLMPRPQDAGCVRTLDYIDTAHVVVTGSFDDYWNARGRNLRNNLKKQRNRLEREGVALRLEVSRAPEDVAQAVADYGRLESSGWKAARGTAVNAANAQGRYYRRMLEAFCRRGKGSVYRYWFGDRLAAMDLCIEDDGTLIVLKTSYDESLPSSLSPTHLMREEAMRHLFEEGGIHRIEFYGRVMGWHLRWTEQVRTMYHVNYYRWPGLRRLHALLEARPTAKPDPARAPTENKI